MTTDPGDLVLDPTCGSGTTAYVAEQWGRRWITIDTSRVAIALARSRLMGARYPYYLLADSPQGQQKEAEVSRTATKTSPTRGDIRQGFIYERVPHITLKSIANNTEIDVIWERMQPAVEEARAALNTALKDHAEPFAVTTGGRAGQAIDFRATGEVTLPSGEPAPAGGFMEWEIPREAGTPWPEKQQRLLSTVRAFATARSASERAKAEAAVAELNALKGASFTLDNVPARPVTPWPAEAESALAAFWEARIARQRAIDASIAARAEHEYLYDKPYSDNSKVRVAGPFTVESLSPHRTLAVDWNDELIEQRGAAEAGPAVAYDGPSPEKDFAGMILDNLRAAGVQQAHKEDRITFTSLKGWPGRLISADTIRLGTLRLAEEVGQKLTPGNLREAVDPLIAATFMGIARMSKGVHPENLIAIGAPVRALASIARNRRQVRVATISRESFEKLFASLSRVNGLEIVSQYGLADIDAAGLLPCCHMLEQLFEISQTSRIIVPMINTRDALAEDFLREIVGDPDPFVPQIVSSAEHLGQRYGYDREHARKVADLALILFDHLGRIHSLPPRARVLLEVVALLHDIGMFISNRQHHKHSYYLLRNSELPGISEEEQNLISLVARYHRRATPRSSHLEFTSQTPEDRVTISKLAAILRVADALDRAHQSKIKNLHVSFDREKVVLSAMCNRDLTLAQWGLRMKADMFEQVFGRRVVLQNASPAGG